MNLLIYGHMLGCSCRRFAPPPPHKFLLMIWLCLLVLVYLRWVFTSTSSVFRVIFRCQTLTTSLLRWYYYYAVLFFSYAVPPLSVLLTYYVVSIYFLLSSNIALLRLTFVFQVRFTQPQILIYRLYLFINFILIVRIHIWPFLTIYLCPTMPNYIFL